MAVQDGTLNGGSAQSDGQPTGNAYLDALIWGAKWNFPAGQTTLTYAFDTLFPAFLESEKQAFRQIVANFESVCKVDFVEVSDTGTFDIFWRLDFSLPGGALAFHEVPDETTTEPLEGFFAIGHAGWDNMPIQGSFSYNTVLHEIGHGMGLAHPHDGGSQSDGTTFPGVTDGSESDTGDNGLNQGIWTVMSYNDGWDQAPGVNPVNSGPSYGWSGTLMAFDIAALQYLYGANTTYNTGSNTYTLVSSNGNGTFWSCIWDAGGIDTISNAGSSTGSTINLNDAPLTGPNAGGFVSRVDGILGGFTIANGAVIENAIGGNAKDVITGNEFANKLEGRDGNDELRGEDGDDELNGGAGDDTLNGGSGVDVAYYADAAAAITVDLSNADGQHDFGRGLDTFVSIEGLIGTNLNDKLSSSNSVRLDGGGGDDFIEGSSAADYLFGGSGAGDTVSYANAAGSVSIRLDQGNTHAVETGGGTDLVAGFENFIGSKFADAIIGIYTANKLEGGEGDDYIFGGTGIDYLDGGDGIDTLSYSDKFGGTDTNAVTIDLLLNTASGAGQANGDIILNFENVVGGSGNDKLTGNTVQNTFQGNAGNDILFGGGGLDIYIFGYNGDTDTIEDFSLIDGDQISFSTYSFVQSLADMFSRGLISESGGDTTIDFGSGDTIVLKGVAAGSLDDSNFVFAVATSIVGTSGHDTIHGSNTAPGQPFASDNEDIIQGLAGDDNISSLGGNDIVDGGIGYDTLDGGDGTDTLIGGAGGDTLTGGADADTFEISDAEGLGDTYSGGSGDDTLRIEGTAAATLSKFDASASSIERLEGNGEGIVGTSGADAVDLSYLSFIADIDFLDGLAGNDTLIGSYLADKIFGGSGDDTLDGGGDDDTLTGGLGNDILTGGSGLDIYIFGFDSDSDTINDFGIADGDIITLTSFSFLQSVQDLFARGMISESGGDTTINFGGGDSILLAGVDANSLTDNHFEFAMATNIVGTAGNDIINGTQTVAGQPFATDGEEDIRGLEGDDNINALGGNDIVEGGAGNDKMVGGNGSDTVTYENALGAVFVTLASTSLQDTKGAGKDTLSQFENLAGSAFDDKLTGDKNNNILDGDDGDDLLIGGLGSDTLTGGANGVLGDTASYAGITVSVSASLAGGQASYANGQLTDTDTFFGIENLVGGSGADQLFGDANANTLDGAGGNDQIFGDAGNDTLIGGLGNDVLQGDDGDDLLIGGAGADAMDGKNDGDTASYAASTVGVTVVLDGITLGKGGDATGDKLSNIEHLIGSAKNDKLTGNGADNKLEGGAGDDTLDGGAGLDEFFGGDGNDTFIGGAGADDYDGGAGNNTVSYAASVARVDIALDDAPGVGKGYANDSLNDKLVNIQNLIGGDGDDTLRGDDNVNILMGGVGNDFLLANASYAGAKGDTLSGGEGDDYIFGFVGDKLDGGLGDDTLQAHFAGFGSTVIVNLATNQFSAGAFKSTIKGFENVRGDSASNILTGTAGVNRLIGEDGNDTIEGGAGADVLDGDVGNAGNDTVVYASSNAGVTIDLTQQGADSNLDNAPAGAQKGGHAEGDALYNFENVIGSKFADKITGAAVDNIIEGGLGNDILDGGAHGANGDTVSFASSTAAITFNLGTQSNVTPVNTGAGNDIIFGFENILGGKGNDKLTGDANKNTIDGAAGNDIIEGDDDEDRLFGGFGIDTISYALSVLGVVILLMEQGSFDMFGNAIDGTEQTGGDAAGDLLWDFENITGSAVGDTLEGDSLANVILGGGGSDTISGLGGKDTLDGGLGIDTLDYSYFTGGQNLALTLGTLNTTTGAVAKTSTSGIVGDIDGVLNFENVTGGAGNDKITGNAGINILEGGGGNDTLSGMAGNDTLNGGGGDDVLEGGLGDDAIDGGADNDTASYATATAGVTVDLGVPDGFQQNTVGAGNDGLISIENLIGSAKSDKLTGDEFDNIIEGGLGDDLLDGKADAGIGDKLSYAGATAAVTFDLGLQGTQQSTGGGGKDTATNFEHLAGGKGNDKLTGDSGNNQIFGGAGNDVLDGGSNGGYDRLIGGAGADKMTAGYLGFTVQFEISGTDAIGDVYTGGINDDSLVITGIGSATLSKFDAAVSSIERLNGNTFGIVGTTGADAIDLSHLNFIDSVPFIDGLGGNDKITGSFAIDTIIGGAGNDILDGKGGADHLHGGLGLDVLTGGLGADTFHIKWAEGADNITDFVSGVDEIELDLLPTQNPTQLLSAPGVTAHNGPDAALIYNETDGKLYYDPGATGANVLIATLTNTATIDFGDFTFV